MKSQSSPPPPRLSSNRKASGLASALLVAGAGLMLVATMMWHAGLIDAALYHDLHLTNGSALVRPVKLFTTIGSFAVVAPLALIGALILLRRGNRGDAIFLVLTFALGRLAALVLKAMAHRPRPPLDERLQHVTSWSFPSAHSADSMMVFLLLALTLSTRPAAIAVAIAGSLAIGWSRIALGVHWPSDVLAGWGCACLCTGLAMIVRARLSRRPPSSP